MALAWSMSPLPGMPFVSSQKGHGVCVSCGGGTYKGRPTCYKCLLAQSRKPPRVKAPKPVRVFRSAEELSRHKAGDHSLCSPDRARHGICVDCGKTVQVSRSSAPPELRRCKDCRSKMPPPSRAPRVCVLCECEYVPKYASHQNRPTGQRWCSKSCAQAWRNGARPPYNCQLTKMARQVAVARAKRLRHAETWDGITDEEILERDGWRCQIPGCKRRPIRKDAKYPHSRSKSIDHIIPLSLGGDDTAVNKRAAHLGCNLGRGNKAGLEQVALFGVIREPPLVTRTHNGVTVRPPRPRRLCGICGEPLVAGRCDLHLPVFFLACDHCGGWFAARNRKRPPGASSPFSLAARRYCRDEACRKQRAAQRREQMPEDARDRKRRRDRDRRWVDPAYRARALAATARWHDRRRAALVTEMESAGG